MAPRKVPPFPFERDPETEISEWQAYRFAVGDLEPNERATLEAKAADSVSGRRILADAERARQSSEGETIPARLRDKLEAPKRRRVAPWAWVSLVAAPACAVLLFVLGGPRGPLSNTADEGESVRFKGEASLRLGVRRTSGEVVVMDVRDVDVLHPGEQLRLQVTGGHDWLELETRGMAGWQEAFKGPVRPGGWLPLGFEVTDTAPIRLRWRSCVAGKGPPQRCASGSADIPVEAPK